jgi:MFS family permease
VSVRGVLTRTFSSLSVRNYRLYFIGQVTSLAGTWTQQVAQVLLVLKLTDSGTALGFLVALQFVPVLVLGPWAGVLSDRVPKRRLLMVTQSSAGLAALTLGVLVATGSIQLWMVDCLAFWLGLSQAFDNPARQSFVSEMVGVDRLANAVSLNAVMVNLARIVGPAIAGLLIITSGLSACFFVNAASYLAVITSLALMRSSELALVERSTTRPSLREGFAYVRRTPEVLYPLLLMAVVGLFAYEFTVSLPLLAKRTFHDANIFGVMSVLQGAGAVIGGLVVAMRYRARGPLVLSYVSLVFGAFVLLVAAAPTLPLALVFIVPMGAASISFISIGNTIVQTSADPSMRGRVMALWSVAFMGSTPIGGPLVGWLADQFGARSGVAIGGIAAIVAGLVVAPSLRRVGDNRASAPTSRARPAPNPTSAPVA